MSKEHILLQ